MTEERIKELAEECYGALPAWGNEEDAVGTIAKYIRTVAAEAREEGREEGIDEMRNSLTKWGATGVVWINIEEVDAAAERLKEKP